MRIDSLLINKKKVHSELLQFFMIKIGHKKIRTQFGILGDFLDSVLLKHESYKVNNQGV